MDWLFLFLAGLAEVASVIFVRLSDGFRRTLYTIPALIAGGISFCLLSQSLRTIPIAVAYGILTGIGAAGSVIIGILFFKESCHWKRIFYITCIVIGMIGLRVLGVREKKHF